MTMLPAPVQGGGAMDPNSSFVVLHSILSEYQGARNDALRFCLSPVVDVRDPHGFNQVKGPYLCIDGHQ